MTKETETTATVDPIAEAQAAVDAAIEAQAAAKASVKELSAELKTAKANSKQADAYRKTLTADTDAATVAAADEAVTGWAAEVERLVSAVASAKETAGPGAVKAAREALKQAKADAKGVTTPKIERVEQNGIKHPVGDGASATVWAIFDTTQSALGRVPGIGDVIDAAVAAGVKESTTRAAYAHWRKFHGITGRVASEAQLAKQEEAAKAAAEKATAA